MPEAHRSVEHTLLLSDLEEITQEHIGLISLRAMTSSERHPTSITSALLRGLVQTEHEHTYVEVNEFLFPDGKTSHLLIITDLTSGGHFDTYSVKDDCVRHTRRGPLNDGQIQDLRDTLQHTDWDADFDAAYTP